MQGTSSGGILGESLVPSSGEGDERDDRAQQKWEWEGVSEEGDQYMGWLPAMCVVLCLCSRNRDVAFTAFFFSFDEEE